MVTRVNTETPTDTPVHTSSHFIVLPIGVINIDNIFVHLVKHVAVTDSDSYVLY